MAKSNENNDVKALAEDNNPYISCIRIHGLRILPPFLTDEKRNRMQYYKQLAMKIEEKIKNRKLNIENTSSPDEYNSQSYIESNTDSISYSSDEEPTTLKSQIFSESCRSDVLKMLNDNHIPAINTVPLNSDESDTNKCFIQSDTELPEKPNLSSDVEKIDAENEKSSILVPEQESPRSETVEPPTSDDSNKKISPPLLIRSNSYTLDSPSPFLLALIQQNTPTPTSESKLLENNNKKRRTWDLENAREKWSSIEHDLNVVADKTMGHKRTDTFNSLPPSTNTSPECKMFESRVENLKRADKRVDSLHLPEKETEIPISEHSKQIKRYDKHINNKYISSFITPVRLKNNESHEKVENTLKKTEFQRKTDLHSGKSVSTIEKVQNIPKKEIVLPKKPDIISCEKTEMQIREIIDKIHNEQSKQMTDLIAKQKKEQEDLMKLFAEQQALILSQLRSTYLNKEDTNNMEQSSTKVPIVPESDILQTSENLLFECKKLLQQESVNLSKNQICLSSPDDTIKSDLSFKSSSPSSENVPSSRFNSSYSIDSLQQVYNDNVSQTKKLNRSMSCSRQLFPTKQQFWAASKINACVRGYLVRRLIKTERVQNLIKTIRDTLVCAMQLHHESADKIQTADVELHRRLIQQVTAACYSFHDTFFELSRSDQLQIIATDRERQKEKLLRPLSAKSSVALSSTTQKVLERKMRRSSASDSISRAASRCSSSRSCYSMGEFRVRTKSLGLSDSVQSSKRTSPQNEVIRSAMSYGANKKPWR